MIKNTRIINNLQESNKKNNDSSWLDSPVLKHQVHKFDPDAHLSPFCNCFYLYFLCYKFRKKRPEQIGFVCF